MLNNAAATDGLTLSERARRRHNWCMTRILIFATLLLSACGRGGSATGVSDDRFIDTMVELRRAAIHDPGSYASAKRQILAENEVTEESLRAYIEAHADDLVHLATVWDSINARVAPTAEAIQ